MFFSRNTVGHSSLIPLAVTDDRWNEGGGVLKAVLSSGFLGLPGLLTRPPVLPIYVTA